MDILDNQTKYYGNKPKIVNGVVKKNIKFYVSNIYRWCSGFF